MPRATDSSRPAQEEPTAAIGISGIVAARPPRPSLDTLRGQIDILERALDKDDRQAVFSVLS